MMPEVTVMMTSEPVISLDLLASRDEHLTTHSRKFQIDITITLCSLTSMIVFSQTLIECGHLY